MRPSSLSLYIYLPGGILQHTGLQVTIISLYRLPLSPSSPSVHCFGVGDVVAELASSVQQVLGATAPPSSERKTSKRVHSGDMVTTTAGVNSAAAQGGGLRLASLNHISLVCRSLESSLAFYCDVLGFFPVRRPGSFDFDGAWLFNFGIGVHLLQAEDPESMPPKKTEINPKDNHISFTCESLEVVQQRLKEMGINYEHRLVEEGGIHVDQIFFHDPDGFMIEVCTCENLPVIPLTVSTPVCKRAVPDPVPVKKANIDRWVGEAIDVPAVSCALMACPERCCCT